MNIKKTVLSTTLVAMMAISTGASAQFLVGGIAGGVGAVSVSSAEAGGMSQTGPGFGIAGGTSGANAANQSYVGIQGLSLQSGSMSQAEQYNVSGSLGNAAAGNGAVGSADGGAGAVVVGGIVGGFF